MQLFILGIRGDNQFFATLVVNSQKKVEAVVEGEHAGQDLQGGNAVVVQLNKGDLVWVQRNNGLGGNILNSYTGVRVSTFSAVLFHPIE